MTSTGMIILDAAPYGGDVFFAELTLSGESGGQS